MSISVPSVPMDYKAIIDHLDEINPTGSINQWTYMSFDISKARELVKILHSKLLNPLRTYHYDNSLIAYSEFESDTSGDLYIENGIPQKLLKYTVYHKICEKECTSNTYHIWNINTNFCKTDLNDIRTIDCHGDKCRRSVSLIEDNIWCTACHGEFGASELFSLMGSVKFSQIPKEYILHIEDNSSDIDYSDRVQLNGLVNIIEADYNKIQKIEDNVKDGGGYDQEIKRYIESIKARKETDLKLKEKISDKYKGDIVKILETVKTKRDEMLAVEHQALFDKARQKILDQQKLLDEQQKKITADLQALADKEKQSLLIYKH